MNKRSRDTLLKLEASCSVALKDPRQQSRIMFRGEMWAIISAVHELRKLGKLPADPPPEKE